MKMPLWAASVFDDCADAFVSQDDAGTDAPVSQDGAGAADAFTQGDCVISTQEAEHTQRVNLTHPAPSALL